MLSDHITHVAPACDTWLTNTSYSHSREIGTGATTVGRALVSIKWQPQGMHKAHDWPMFCMAEMDAMKQVHRRRASLKNLTLLSLKV
jgi:hypothetical protein